MALVLAASLQVPTEFDDAYVFVRYADHLLAGHGIAWDPAGPQTFGCTSLLFVFWIAALRLATGLTDPPGLLAWGSWLPAAATALLLALTCRRLASCRILRHPAVALGFVAACLLLPDGIPRPDNELARRGFFFHVGSGMDTTMAMCANALLALVVLGVGRRRWRLRRLLLVAAVS